MPNDTKPERIEVLATKFRMSVPTRYHREPLASKLANRVAYQIDAEDVIVSETTNGEVWLYFTIRDTRSDQRNLDAIRRAIMDIADGLRSA